EHELVAARRLSLERPCEQMILAWTPVRRRAPAVLRADPRSERRRRRALAVEADPDIGVECFHQRHAFGLVPVRESLRKAPERRRTRASVADAPQELGSSQDLIRDVP